jgi:hypothetical protein
VAGTDSGPCFEPVSPTSHRSIDPGPHSVAYEQPGATHTSSGFQCGPVDAHAGVLSASPLTAAACTCHGCPLVLSSRSAYATATVTLVSSNGPASVPCHSEIHPDTARLPNALDMGATRCTPARTSRIVAQSHGPEPAAEPRTTSPRPTMLAAPNSDRCQSQNFGPLAPVPASRNRVQPPKLARQIAAGKRVPRRRRPARAATGA